MPTLERSNPLPLYFQLKEVLKQQILVGHLTPHTAIPSEPELIAQWHVSRATVRQALSTLVNEGLIYREHGRGTFVREPRVAERNASGFTSLSEALRRQGKQPGGLLLVSELVRGSQTVREYLHLADEMQVLLLERVRTADGLPIAYERDYLPYPLSQQVYQRAKETAEGSLYDLMAVSGLQPFLAEERVSSTVISAHAADLLQTAAGSPGMRIACTTFDEAGIPLVYSEVLFPADRYVFQVSMRVNH